MNPLDFLQSLQDIKNSQISDDVKHSQILVLVAETDLDSLITQLKEMEQ
jgi:hypothetical protein